MSVPAGRPAEAGILDAGYVIECMLIHYLRKPAR